MKVNPLNDFEFCEIPLGDNPIEITEEEFNGIIARTHKFNEERTAVIPLTEKELEQVIEVCTQHEEAQRKSELRIQRANLLLAFDKYKGNVYYGIEEETKEEHANIVAWYESLLDLSEESFENIPDKIQYYL